MNQERILTVLLAPHVSEKSAIMADTANKYVFKVEPTATKIEVKSAVESLFNVKVSTVNVLNQKGKTKVFKGRKGRRNGVRKAIVTLAAGQEIDFANAE